MSQESRPRGASRPIWENGTNAQDADAMAGSAKDGTTPREQLASAGDQGRRWWRRQPQRGRRREDVRASLKPPEPRCCGSRRPRPDTVPGPDRGRSVSVLRRPGIAAALLVLPLAPLRPAALKDERSAGQGGILLSSSRQHRSKPTHGIGRYKHLVQAQEPKKKRAKVEVRPINMGTDYEYGVLNIHLTAYDMALAESYAQYVHNLCNHLAIKVEESYAMPTKTMEVLRLQDQGSKMFLDSVLTTHERVVQISGLSATFAEIFLEIIQNNLPEGVRLSVKEHTEEDFKGRFKARPELEELLAKLN
ncbi:39S ribosomal protein L48, mitochondrial isoform X1 [Sorex araneus]|uniref:39S ribosomal protein L48, mitochondrial isoform X1 n=1 Tax=Sorex araneus TaxID=42254 RepID=UPI00243341AB|nr:39S ribosomal protein L48, mitochondrial isoform X1 [Sorex araneus]